MPTKMVTKSEIVGKLFLTVIIYWRFSARSGQPLVNFDHAIFRIPNLCLLGGGSVGSARQIPVIFKVYLERLFYVT